LFKTAAARVERISTGTEPSAAPTTTGLEPVDGVTVPETRGGPEAMVIEQLTVEGSGR
jgi:hypothetical protein